MLKYIYLLLTILFTFISLKIFLNKSKLIFPSDFYIEIKLESTEIVKNEGIGNDLRFISYTQSNLEITEDFTKINLGNKTKLIIISETMEIDPNHDDIGNTDFNISPININEIFENNGFEVEVITKEHYGPGAGKKAKSLFKYKVRKSS